MSPIRICPLLFTLSITWVLLVPAFGQTPLDLKTAMQYAMTHHSEVQRAALEVEKGRELVRESIATGLPQVGVHAQMVYNPSLRTSLIPAEFFGGPAGQFQSVKFGTNWNGSSSIYLDQMLFSKTWLMGLRASYAVNDFYKLLLDKTKEDVAYEVAKLYYQVQLSRAQKGILEANLEQVAGLYNTLSKQYEQGMATRTDKERLQVQKFNLETELKNLDLYLSQAEQALKFAMNMPLETEIALTDSINEEHLDAVDRLMAHPAFAQKTDLMVLKQQMKLYDLDERRWQAGYFPTLSFFANYNYEWQANSLDEFGTGQNWSNFSQLGVRLQAPIFDGFYKDSKRQTAMLNKRQVGLQLDHVLAGLQLQHQTALSTLKAHQNTLESLRENIRVAEDVYAVAQKRYRQGIGNIVELLDAESSLRSAQANYLTVLAQLKLAEIDLLHANGQLIQLGR